MSRNLDTDAVFLIAAENELSSINRKVIMLHVVFADDFSVAGSLKNFKDYWDKLATIFPKCNFFSKPTKSYLIVKEGNWWKCKTYLLIQERTSQLKEKCKLNYCLRTIPNISHLLLSLERTIRNKFIPAVKGCHICSDKERVLISLLTRHGGLTISIFPETAEIEFMNSSKITLELRAPI